MAEGGGIMAPADVRGAGAMEWATISGLSPTNPLVGGPDWQGPGFDVDRGHKRIVTTPEGQLGPATDGIMATPDGPALALLDDWRDLFNFRGSPMPWLLLFALVFLGLMQFRVQARAGSARASAALG